MIFIRRMWVTLGLTAALAGGDWAQARTPEERINAARPMKPEVLEARKSLEAALEVDARANAGLRAELTARDKVRALTCAKGYEPSAFESREAIAKRLTDQQCFDDYDRQTIQWLKMRKLHGLLMAGPLRAVPAKPVSIFAAAGGVNAIQFATEAPVAVVLSNRTVEIIDAGSGSSIFVDRQLPEYYSSIAISPNGRVFGGSSAPAGTKLRDSQTGEVLVDLPEYLNFAWIDSQTGIAARRSGGVDVLDLAADVHAARVKGVDGTPSRVLPLPGLRYEFLASQYGSILRYTVKRDASGTQAVLQDKRTGPRMNWSDKSGEATADGTSFVQASGDLWITNLKTLESEPVSLRPFYATNATPMPNPDEVLLIGDLRPNSASRAMIYSIAGHTFAPVEDDRLTPLLDYTTVRTVLVPTLNRIAIVEGGNVQMLDDVKRGPRYSLAAMVQRLNEDKQALQEEKAREIAAREGFKYGGVVDGTPVMDSPLLAVVKGAQIEGVGVYESKNGSHGFGQPSIPGVVTISLRPAPKPIVLVLSSNEPVLWRITGARAANLKAVLLGGPGASTVSGEEGVSVTSIGKLYAYERAGSGFTSLQQAVIRHTGQTFSTFQGMYSGMSFIVGGR